MYDDYLNDELDSYNDEIEGYNDDLRSLEDDRFMLKSSGIYTKDEVEQIIANHEEND